MTRSIDDIADAFRAAGADRAKSSELLASLYADTVQMQHSPPGPGDGPWLATTLVALAKQEVAAVGRALPDALVHPPVVSIEGDALRIRNRIEGDLADGTRIDITTNTVFTVADGRIVGLRSEMDPTDAQTWIQVLTAGAFEVPVDL
jgi:hypothetical protein